MLHSVISAAANSEIQINSNNSAIFVTLFCLAIVVIALIIMVFTKKFSKDITENNQADEKESEDDRQANKYVRAEDEKTYLREIRNYVRIIAIIAIAGVILSILSALIIVFNFNIIFG